MAKKTPTLNGRKIELRAANYQKNGKQKIGFAIPRYDDNGREVLTPDDALALLCESQNAVTLVVTLPEDAPLFGNDQKVTIKGTAESKKLGFDSEFITGGFTFQFDEGETMYSALIHAAHRPAIAHVKRTGDAGVTEDAAEDDDDQQKIGDDQ